MADSALYTAALAIYDFENNANDTKGAKNLTASGTVAYSTTGEAQGTYWTGHFMADGYFTRTDADFRLTSGDWALSFWFSCDYVTSGVGPEISCCDGTNGWRVYMDGSRHIAVSHYVSGTPRTSTFSGYNFNDSTRYHVVIFYDDSADTYSAWVSTTSFGNCINGTTVAQAYNPTSSAEVFRVNNGPGGEGYGNYDEVVFWKAAITSTDAQAIFNARDGGTSWREEAGGGGGTANNSGSLQLTGGGITRSINLNRSISGEL